MITYCGLYCTKFKVCTATLNNENLLYKRVSKEWGEMNQFMKGAA